MSTHPHDLPDWLVADDRRESSPHVYPAGDRRVQPIDTVVIHWTASPYQPRGPLGADEARIRSWGRGERGETSTHFTVLRDGTVLQLAPLSARCWHAGGSKTADGRGAVNGRSIGIDLENVGPLHFEQAPSGGHFANAYGGAHRGPVWSDGKGAEWEPYTAPQMHALLTLAQALAHLAPQLADPAAWVGHCDIRHTKLDPGPAFPWPWLQAVVAGGASPMDVTDWTAVPGVVVPLPAVPEGVV